MKLPLSKSLRFRMPLVVLIGVIPLILVAILYASDRASRTIRQEAEENMALKAQLLAESVNRWDESNVLALRNLSKQPDMVSMNPQWQELVLTELIDTYEHFYLAMTTDLDGWNVARSDRHKPVYFGDRKWFLGAKQGNNVTYQTLIGRTTKRLALCLSTPIRQQYLEIVGVTVLCTDLEAIVQQIGRLQFGKTGYALLVNQSGIVLAHPNPEFISGKQLTDLSSYPPVKNILENGSAEFSFPDERGVQWFSYGTRLENGWAILVLQEEAELFKSKKEFQKLAFFIASVAVLGVSALTWLLANRLIQPITNLTDAATTISSGQLNRRVEIKRQDELGILAKSFNQMASQLKSLFEELEERIDRRTAQLKQAKETAEKAKEAAETANQAKDRFLANISHELRTPLNSILGYTKILKRDANLNPDQLHDLSIVQESGTHLLTLINDILDFSKTKAGKIELYPTNLHLPSFLDGVVGIVEMWSKEKGLELKCETENNLPTGIQADEKRLRQILINLLSNAIKFTSKGEVILKVSAIETIKGTSDSSLVQQKLCFEVSDTGVGMSPQELKKIFQPFEQVGDAQFRSAGTGLGLSISQQLVKVMGSQLKGKSKLGQGSTFWFDAVFAVVEVVLEVEEDRTAEILGYKGRQRQLLVVDDKEANRLLLVNILKPLGFEVLTAENGQRMLEIASLTEPDLILLDLFMPVKTGFVSAKELRQKPELKNIPIIVLSASSIPEQMSQYIDCEAYLSKPIDEEKLLALLEQYLHLEWIYQEVFTS